MKNITGMGNEIIVHARGVGEELGYIDLVQDIISSDTGNAFAWVHSEVRVMFTQRCVLSLGTIYIYVVHRMCLYTISGEVVGGGGGGGHCPIPAPPPPSPPPPPACLTKGAPK